MFYIKFTWTAAKWYFDSSQRAKLDISHLDVLSMIVFDTFFHERNQPTFTLVVVKFYNGLRNVHYHERIKILNVKCKPQLRFLYLCCLLWLDSSILSVAMMPMSGNWSVHACTVDQNKIIKKKLPIHWRKEWQKFQSCKFIHGQYFWGNFILHRNVIQFTGMGIIVVHPPSVRCEFFAELLLVLIV